MRVRSLGRIKKCDGPGRRVVMGKGEDEETIACIISIPLCSLQLREQQQYDEWTRV
jgi:hypothetical protein